VIGEVVWFDAPRGFGYIRPNDGTRFVLFHISAIQEAAVQAPTQGQRFQFEIGEHDGKRAAIELAYKAD
jgi:CspA family cold shock protein